MVFAGKINTQISADVRTYGIEAVELSDVGDTIVYAVCHLPTEIFKREIDEREEIDYGCDGDFMQIDWRVLDVLLDQNYLLVIPLGRTTGKLKTSMTIPSPLACEPKNLCYCQMSSAFASNRAKWRKDFATFDCSSIRTR